MRKYLVLFFISIFPPAYAQGDSVQTNSLWENWYVLTGVDMTLQNPYGQDFKKVFPKGKTFGVDVGVGKWFSPQLGIMATLNWENGIKLLENGHAEWLAPFGEPGGNMKKGGNVSLVGDVLLNLYNLFGEYRAGRKWNTMVHPRAGAIYSFGSKDGSPLLGLGVENTYAISDKCNLALDVSYNMVSGAVVNPGNTGIGSGSNGFFDVILSVQTDIGRRNVGTKTDNFSKSCYGFWSNWFVQAGLDMSLQNPYGCNFTGVFPNGKTYGLNIAIGKWFTPEVALRGNLNWENGLIENRHVTWLPPADAPRANYEGGGYAVVTADVLLNLKNLFGIYDRNRKWNVNAYPKAGLIRHFHIGSGSPLVGAGIENCYRLTNRLNLYVDVDYQVTTSESSVNSTGANSGSNGFFRLEAGTTINLGKI